MVLCSCVQVAVRTLSVVALVRASRKLPNEVCVIAIEPVAASVDPAPTGTVTVLPLTVADTDVSRCAFADGPVGLPLQPAAAPRARRPAHAQNSRRVGIELCGNLITAVTSSGQRAPIDRAILHVSKNRDNRFAGTDCHP